VALAELPTYFGYSITRIEALTGRTWWALSLAAFWLAAQHIALPLVFDGKFILWRFLAFIPLALVVGLIYLRTRRLLPLMITHGLIDLSLGWTVFAMSLG
jgi:membrane protease YdiL (CAAX protease family)